MPRKLAHELLGALFNGPGLNPAGYEALKQDFAARLRAVLAASIGLKSEQLFKAVNTIVRQLIDEQTDPLEDDDGEDADLFRARKMASIVQLSAELMKHIQLASTSTTSTTTERN